MYSNLLTASLLLGAINWQSVTSLTTSESSIRSADLLLPHGFIEIDLDQEEAYQNGNLTKRKDVEVCQNQQINSGSYSCSTLTETTIQAVAGSIASQLKADSNANDCSAHSGSTDNFNYVVTASGRNCDTTAQRVTIDGALQKTLRSLDGSRVCGVLCLNLNHAGTWRGHVSLAGSRYQASSYACSGNTGNPCTFGGKGDCQGDQCS